MFIDVNKYVKTLVDFNITADQFLLLWLTHLKDYKLLYRYVSMGDGFTSNVVADLEKKGYLLNLNNTYDNYVDSFIVTDKFKETLFNSDDEIAPQEFWDNYPRLLYINGKRFSARAINKDKFFEDYQKEVGHSIDKHNKVMNCLKYAVKNRLISMGIQKWFESKQWETIEEEIELRRKMGQNELPGEKIV